MLPHLDNNLKLVVLLSTIHPVTNPHHQQNKVSTDLAFGSRILVLLISTLVSPSTQLHGLTSWSSRVHFCPLTPYQYSEGVMESNNAFEPRMNLLHLWPIWSKQKTIYPAIVPRHQCCTTRCLSNEETIDKGSNHSRCTKCYKWAFVCVIC